MLAKKPWCRATQVEVTYALMAPSANTALEGDSAARLGLVAKKPSESKINNRRNMFASLQIVKSRAIVLKYLPPGHVAHVFNLQEFIQRTGKVRVDVRVVR